jgi:hypothetical protein
VLVWVVIVIPKINIRVSLACHFCSFLRTVSLGGLVIGAGLCIGGEPAPDCLPGLRSALWRNRVLPAGFDEEQTQLQSFATRSSYDGDDSAYPKNHEKSGEEKQACVFSEHLAKLHKPGEE